MIKLKELLKEEKLTEGKVDRAFTKIIGLLRKESRKLNDDDSYELSTKLKQSQKLCIKLYLKYLTK